MEFRVKFYNHNGEFILENIWESKNKEELKKDIEYAIKDICDLFETDKFVYKIKENIKKN